ncbi:MAG: hypothetical protein WC743_08625 [Mucilaginibacter sp.]
MKQVSNFATIHHSPFHYSPIMALPAAGLSTYTPAGLRREAGIRCNP